MAVALHVEKDKEAETVAREVMVVAVVWVVGKEAAVEAMAHSAKTEVEGVRV
jgi:hypothetical protein